MASIALPPTMATETGYPQEESHPGTLPQLLLSVDEILHHFETIANFLLVFTVKASPQGFSGGAKWISSIDSMFVGGRVLWIAPIRIESILSDVEPWAESLAGGNRCKGWE